MNEEQVREIAQQAFTANFGDIDVVCVNVKRGFDHCDDPMFEVAIIYDAEFEHLTGAGIQRVESEIVAKVWCNAMRNARVFVNPLRARAFLCYSSMMLDVAERAGQMSKLAGLRDASGTRVFVTSPPKMDRRG